VGMIALARRCRSPADARSLAGGIATAALPIGCALLCGEPFVAMMDCGFAIAVAIAWSLASRDPPSESPLPDSERSGFSLPFPRAVVAVTLALVLGAGLGAVA